MSVTIDSLDIQIRSSAGSAKQNIEGLAKALERLNGQAKVTKIVNVLDKLNVSLTNLRSNSGVMGQLSSLSKSLSQLASIPQLTGLKSAITQIAKLPEVVKKLNSANMTQFTQRMKQLSKALAPLATQLATISTAFSKLPPKINQVVTATNRMNRAVHSSSNALNAQSINLMASVQNLQDLVSALHFVGDAAASVMAGAIEWDGIQFRFGRAFGEDAEEVYAYAQKVSDVLKINIQQFMQYSSLYGSLLSGFGMAQDKVTTISVGLTELSYDIWAAYNDRFKTLEDASEAVRSAITGEIEPIRNAGIALTEASLQEYLESVGMASVSIEKLTEAQKAEVRYAAMVNAAMNQGIVGTYAREMQTAEGAVRTLTQQMKTLGQAIGSLFLPILQMVVPWLSAFVELIYEGVVGLAALLGIPFQEITWDKSASGLGNMAESAGDASDALGDAADAAKKLRSYTMGFDELNIIDPTSANANSGGAGGEGGGWGTGLDLETLWDESVFEAASKQVDEIKQKIKDFYEEWKWQIDLIAAALGVLGISKLLTHLGQALGLGENFLGVMGTISKLAVSAIVITLQWTLMDEFLNNFIEEGSWADFIKAAVVAALGALAMYALWGPAGLVISLGVTAAVSLKAAFGDSSFDSLEEVATLLTGIASAVGAVVIAIKKTGLIKLIKDAWVALAPIISKVGAFLGGVSGTALAWIAGIIAAIAAQIYYLVENWDYVVATAKTFFDLNIAPKLEKIKESWDDLQEALKPIKHGFEVLGEVVSKLFSKIDWESVFGVVLKIVEVIGGILFAITASSITGALSSLLTVISGIVQFITGAVEVITGLSEIIAGFISGDMEQAKDGLKSILDGIVDMFGGLWNATAGAVIGFVEGVVGWFVSMGEPIWGTVEDIKERVKEKLENLWTDVKEWWHSKVAPKFTKKYWLNKFGAIRSAIEEKLEDVKKAANDKWGGIKEWFSANVAPMFTIDYWLNKFDAIRSAIKEKLEEVKRAAKDKWGEIKEWFSTNVAPMFTINYWKDKFDVIRGAIVEKLEAVKQAAKDKWGEIKEWFSANIAPKFTLNFWLAQFENLRDGFVQTIKNMLNAGIDLFNAFVGWLNSKLSFSWEGLTIAGEEIFPGGSVQLFTIPLITQRFSDGGFIEDGLFTMNHGEIAGKFSNGKSVVANNQQIVEGIAAGVYEAVVAAMSATSGRQDQNVNVYLDGKQIYANVKKRDSERGVQIIGNQMGYSY